MSVPQAYSRSQVWLHWVVAALVVAQYVFKDAIGRAWDATVSGVPVSFDPLVAAHVVGGIAILALMAWRLVLRLVQSVPPSDEPRHPALRRAAQVAHWAFYAVLIGLSVTGGLAWFGKVEAAATAHAVLKTALVVLVGVHVLAALFHQFVLKTDVMRRMSLAGS